MSGRLDRLALAASVALGIWVYAAPEVLGLTGGARLGHLVAGAVAAAVATISFSSVARGLVRVDVAIGAYLALSPLLFPHGPAWPEPVAAGAALAVLALVPRPRPERFGGGWRALLT